MRGAVRYRRFADVPRDEREAEYDKLVDVVEALGARDLAPLPGFTGMESRILRVMAQSRGTLHRHKLCVALWGHEADWPKSVDGNLSVLLSRIRRKVPYDAVIGSLKREGVLKCNQVLVDFVTALERRTDTDHV